MRYFLQVWDEVIDHGLKPVYVEVEQDERVAVVAQRISDVLCERFGLVGVVVTHVREQNGRLVIQEDLGGGRLAVIIACPSETS
jgi:hypothetical protein